jgi:hypothetical protein
MGCAAGMLCALALLVANSVPVSAAPVVIYETQKLLRVGTPDDHDTFAGSVALSGNALVAGSYTDLRPSTFESGAA